MSETCPECGTPFSSLQKLLEHAVIVHDLDVVDWGLTEEEREALRSHLGEMATLRRRVEAESRQIAMP